MTLRPLTIDDSKSFFYASWNDKVAQVLPGFYCDNEEKARNVITKLTTDPKINALAICNSANAFAGVVVIVETGKNEIEISSFIDEKFRHQGLATQSLKQIISMYNGYKICFQVEPYNTYSVKIMEKFGAILKDTYYYHIYA
ncbi:MAG: GNAT family N-acetyltransferase [Clostridia bacterium]|nr:GNAT family N-acetyltransferase [Clostridia bacterium]